MIYTYSDFTVSGELLGVVFLFIKPCTRSYIYCIYIGLFPLIMIFLLGNVPYVQLVCKWKGGSCTCVCVCVCVCICVTDTHIHRLVVFLFAI